MIESKKNKLLLVVDVSLNYLVLTAVCGLIPGR